MQAHTRTIRLLLPAAAVWALLTTSFILGCSKELSGRYDERSGIGSLDFHDNGRVYVTMSDMTVVGEYAVDGDRVVIKGPRGGSQVYTRSGDALLGGYGMMYIKQ